MNTLTNVRQLGVISGLSLMLACGSAQALLVTSTGNSTGSPSQPTYQADIGSADVGQSFTFDWLVPAGTMGDSLLPVDLSATVIFNINAFTLDATGDDTLSLQIGLSNTTDLSAYPNSNSAILSFGFGVAPDASAVFSSTGAVFNGIDSGSGPQQTFAGGFKQIDVCVFSANGCKGGDVNDGLQAGDSDSLSIDILGDFDQGGMSTLGTVTLYDFPLKFQGTWGSFETPGQQIPAPGTLILFGSALLGLSMRRGRKGRRK